MTRRPLTSPARLVATLGLLVPAALCWGGCPATDRAPPIYSTVPDFLLTGRSGAPFSSRELQGRVWIASFMFTRCPTICPALASRLAEVQARTADLDDLHLVTFSVDPEFDRPAVLDAFGRRIGAGPRWHLVTGDFEAIRSAVEGGLKVAVGRVTGGEVVDPTQVLHGTHVVLVDGQGRIRGYHDVRDEEGTRALLAAARTLIE